MTQIDRLDLLVLYTFSLLSAVFLIVTYGAVPGSQATTQDVVSMLIGAGLGGIAAIAGVLLQRGPR